MKKQKAFTIIELLVVIAILGLLAAIILMSMKDSRDKAIIANALQFSASVKNALGSEIVGGWYFDEGVGGTCAGGDDVCDNSGYGSHGINNNIVEWVDNEISELGKAVCFDNPGEYIQIDLPDIFENKEVFTIEVWVKPTAPMAGMDYIMIEQDTDYILAVDGGEVKFVLSPFNWIETGYILEVGKWHHILVAYSGSEEIRVFINAEEVSTTAILGSASTTIWDNSFFIAERLGLGSFNGCVDNLNIYNSKLGISQIKQLYVKKGL